MNITNRATIADVVFAFEKDELMVYRIYISTSQHNEMYLSAVMQALFSINEVALSAIRAEETPVLGDTRLSAARQMIQDAEVFMGLYGTAYGRIPEGHTQSHEEIEYQLATDLDKSMLIFVHAHCRENADERQARFIDHVMQQHVVVEFNDPADLTNKVKVAVDNYRATKRHRRKLRPPAPGLFPPSAQPSTRVDESFEDQVNQAVDIASDDIEQIVRRALELHDAQSKVRAQPDEAFDNKITVAPIWGEPLRRTQFQSDVFMIMPFRERFNRVYTSVIRPLTAELNLTIKRGDEFTSTRGSIMQEVWAALYACKLVIAETTEVNANVYYELGIAHTLGKPAILLTQTKEVEELPFDIRHLRFVVYEDTEAGLAELEDRLRQSIIWLLNDLQEQMPAAD